jgi:putative nucleotidyltransferase with HDIG domain
MASVFTQLPDYWPVRGLRTDIAVVHDATFKPEEVVSALQGYFSLRREELDAYLTNGGLSAHLYVFCTNLGSDQTFRRVKDAVERSDGEKLFVLTAHNSKSVARLHDLGVVDHVLMPVDRGALRAGAKQAINRRIESSWAKLDASKQKALKTSLASFERCFECTRRGQPLPMEDVDLSCQHIREAARLGGLDGWIDALDDHHNYSFRHSMFVCGTMVYFAHAIGIEGTDLERLTIGGLLHDVGKSLVPLEILDKPGKLEDNEWKLMRKHPEHSRDVLLREHGLDPDAIAMAVQHHEKLDGTGYPDGLAGAQINDYVRLTAISDVYSALIDKRSYKEAMSNEDALDLMGRFQGHLDMDLLGAFRGFVLDQG